VNCGSAIPQTPCCCTAGAVCTGCIRVRRASSSTSRCRARACGGARRAAPLPDAHDSCRSAQTFLDSVSSDRRGISSRVLLGDVSVGHRARRLAEHERA
jgi:hypothetical protein